MDTRNILNRAYAHWLEDGIFEIWMGILLAGVGTLRAIIHLAGHKTAAYYWLSAGLFVFMIGIAWGGKRFGDAVKARVTYPRTGYMSFRSYISNYKSVLAILVLLIFTGVLGVFVGMLATQPNQQKIGGIVPIGQGIVGAIILAYTAHRVEQKRFYYLAAFSIVIGLVIGLLGIGVVLGLSFFYLSIGLALVVSGCLALMLYLHSYEPVDLNGMSQ
jgi:hypothetical protein